MKLLKNGFAVVIAILTIGLTIAAQAGAFKSETKAASLQTTCDPDVRPVGPTENLYTRNASGQCVLYTGTKQCPLPSALFAQGLGYTEFECLPADPNVFCCASLSSTPSCVLSGITRFQIASIICGEPEL